MGLFQRFGKPAAPHSSPKSQETLPPGRQAPRVVPEIAVAFGIVGMMTEAEPGGMGEGFVCMPVAGESFYQDGLRALKSALDFFDRPGCGFEAWLTPEPTNAHDPNAVIVASAAGEKLGYLRADVARDYHRFIASLEGQVACAARLTGGTDDRPMIGVVLDFADLKNLRAKIGDGQRE